ncbi:beta-ketoacyl synthase N-terminal-like domain-containing protein, partial [Saccharomonospora sp. NPDC046836]|uniref:beta-ketoacyl synthase N-terminal-like domain-containing protein n=1 Tax=Saccharomonospora sp. NPDC046836 TaxID=3156921 RepID=UPI0033DFB021
FGGDPDGPRRVREILLRRYPHAGPHPQRFLPHIVVRDAAWNILPDTSELVVVDSACSAAMFAVDAGVRSLLLGDADVAFCGGVSSVTPTECVTMSRLGVMSTSGEVRPFDHGGTGTLFSDGAAVLALKRLERAQADGDEVLAVLTGVGTSSDGRGKALFTPDARGQREAVLRARRKGSVAPGSTRWLVSHAIGIPAGDAVEYSALDSVTDRTAACHVTSYKSVTGHPSYPSGALGIITAVLGIRNAMIPAQRLFDRVPSTYPAEAGGLLVAAEDVPFPETGPKVVGVSCFGFGGGNGHVVITDRPTATPPHPPGDDPVDDVVLVGWGTHLPGTPDRHRMTADLRSGRLDIPATFGDPYPPPPAALGVPPSVLRRVGRCQPMLLQAVSALADVHDTPWRGLNENTGVHVGLFGPPEVAMTYPQRVHLRAVRRALADAPDTERDRLLPVYDQYRETVLALVPGVTEDAVTGILPNCVAARVSKRFDLRGANMVIDDGTDSTLTALRLAMRALQAGDLDLALVCGVSGNTHPELLTLTRALDSDVTELAEGAFAYALTTASIATTHDLPVLARLRPWSLGQPQPPAVVAAGPIHGRTYLGADGALALLTSLAHTEPEVLVTPHSGDLGGTIPHGVRLLTP